MKYKDTAFVRLNARKGKKTECKRKGCQAPKGKGLLDGATRRLRFGSRAAAPGEPRRRVSAAARSPTRVGRKVPPEGLPAPTHHRQQRDTRRATGPHPRR